MEWQCRPGLLGDLDLHDLTPAHELRNRLPCKANGFVLRRGFNHTRGQSWYGDLDTARNFLSENESVLHSAYSFPCPLCYGIRTLCLSCYLLCKPVFIMQAMQDRPRHDAQMGLQPVGMEHHGEC
jgi:hypothetical protein